MELLVIKIYFKKIANTESFLKRCASYLSHWKVSQYYTDVFWALTTSVT